MKVSINAFVLMTGDSGFFELLKEGMN